MLAIYKRELRSYLHTVTGALFIAATLILTGIYFTAYNLLSGSPYISYGLSSSTFLFMITIPVLTMKILADERKNKTDQLILTAPVSVGKIVLAKYFAMTTIFMMAIALVCFYPAALSFFGEIPFGESYTAILGYALFGLTGIGIGMLVSSLCESQVIAAVLTFLVLFVGYMMSGICSLISSTGNLLTQLLGCFDLLTPLDNFFNGLLDIGGVVYYISLISLFIFLTTQSIQKRRWSISTKSIKTGAYSSTLIIIVFAAVVMANLTVKELPADLTQIDVTSQKLYSLTDDTKHLVEGLEQDITIYVINSEENADETVETTLERYAQLSGHIKVEYKDPLVSPNFYREFADSVSANSLIVVSGDRSKVIDYNSLYEMEYDYYSYSSTVTGYDAEGQITSAIDYVTNEEIPVVYQIEGHGEAALENSFTEVLSKENVELSTISLLQYDKIPEDAACILLLAPTTDLSSDDADKIIAYLENGGKAVISVTLTDGTLPNFDRVLEACGVTNTYGMILENDRNYYYQSPYYLLPNVEYSEVTGDIYSSNYIFSPYTMRLKFDKENEERTVEVFLSTSESAYAKADPATAETLEYEEGDVQGTFDIAALITEGETEVAVIASSHVFTDSADSMVSGANSTLFGNIIAQFTGKEESISVAAKSYSMDNITVSQTGIILLGLLFTVVLPLAILAGGIVVWVRRRRR